MTSASPATVRSPISSQPSSSTGRRPLPTAAQGSKLGPFGLPEWALLTGVALIWGSSFLLIEISLESLEPPVITWVRVTLGFLVLAAFPVARRPVDRADYPRIVFLGVTWVVVPFIALPVAQQHIDSALAGMLNALVPIYSTAITMVLARSLPRVRQAAGILVGFAGAISISLPAVRDSAASAWGVFLVVLTTFMYGVSINVAGPLQQRYGAPAVMMRAIGVATVLTAPFGLAALPGSE